LRYSAAAAAELFRGVVSMKESATYQMILEEGRAEGRSEGAIVEGRRMVRLLGEKDLGPPSAAAAAALDGVNDLTKLEELLCRVRTAATWEDLLALPAKVNGKRRRS
jgi:predicted transposase YdaD